jgi:hypothetical protein
MSDNKNQCNCSFSQSLEMDYDKINNNVNTIFNKIKNKDQKTTQAVVIAVIVTFLFARLLRTRFRQAIPSISEVVWYAIIFWIIYSYLS